MKSEVTVREIDGARRDALIAATAIGVGLLAWPRASRSAPSIVRADGEGTARQVHGGAGLIDVRQFFDARHDGERTLFLHYSIPHGASEGVHTHARGHENGAWDEFYYVLAGRGVMTIDGRETPVQQGDYVHAPLAAPHGIANPGAEPLLVLLTAISRD